MLFSVLIANYNNSRFLTTAINSIISQSYSNWEIVLVDDGSTDEFDQVIQSYAHDRRIHILKNAKNQGCGFTKRRCAANAKGELMGFLDPDDALDPRAIRLMVNAHLDKPAHSMIYSTHYICDEELNVKRIAPYTKELPPGQPYLLTGDGSIHHFVSFKKANYDRTAGIDSTNPKAVDQDLYYLLEDTGPALYLPYPLYYYRIHPGAISNAGQGKRATIAHYTIIEKACQRRIQQVRSGKQDNYMLWIKKYRLRYYKVRLLNSFRKKQYHLFALNLVIYPFVGGMKNIIDYCRKIPKEGFGLIKRSLIESNEIKP